MTSIDATMLEGYLIRTRWFGGKGRPFAVSDTRTLADLPGHGDRPDVLILLVTVDYADDEGGTERYQVPLAAYDEFEERLGHAHVGELRDGARTRHLFDAVHDREAMALWLHGLIAAEGTGVAETGGIRFRRLAGEPLDPALRASPMTGEQSNSSVRFDDTAIMKLFRKVSTGVNPDIEIHEELTRGGSDAIAALYGWVETEVDGEVLQLAMVQEFLRTATDGFELAMGSVRTLLAQPDDAVDESGGDFAGEAMRLGQSLADVHAILRERFPAERLGSDTAAELAATLTARLDAALRSVPEIEPFADAIRAAYDAVAALDGFDVQRVHGDLHLGQTLRTTTGWRIVDFEGEPGRPFAERALPDSPWRDVAGMLRSFDYAPGVVEMSTYGSDAADKALRGERAAAWAARAHDHFIAAYLEALGDAEATDEQRVLLEAYATDKAVYEVVYEARNRPQWIGIPLAALARLEHR